jgi:hypothetical protein
MVALQWLQECPQRYPCPLDSCCFAAAAAAAAAVVLLLLLTCVQSQAVVHVLEPKVCWLAATPPPPPPPVTTLQGSYSVKSGRLHSLISRLLSLLPLVLSATTTGAGPATRRGRRWSACRPTQADTPCGRVSSSRQTAQTSSSYSSSCDIRNGWLDSPRGSIVTGVTRKKGRKTMRVGPTHLGVCRSQQPQRRGWCRLPATYYRPAGLL